MTNPQIDNPLTKTYMSRTRIRLARSTLFGSVVYGITKALPPGIREVLKTTPPEPFNVHNHLTSVIGSSSVGMAAGIGASALYEHYVQPAGTIQQERARQSSVKAVAGLAAGITLNALIETKTGISLTHLERLQATTPDTIDFAYGVAAATIASVAITKTSEVQA